MSDLVVTICYSRCLYCGRRTPHEVCHQHAEALNPGWWDRLEDRDDALESLWGSGRDQEAETCESGACPVWEPGEWERIKAAGARRDGEG